MRHSAKPMRTRISDKRLMARPCRIRIVSSFGEIRPLLLGFAGIGFMACRSKNKLALKAA